MKTKMLWFIFLIVPNILCLAAELTKTDLSVAYWYYNYYEPERLNHPPFLYKVLDTVYSGDLDSLGGDSVLNTSEMTGTDLMADSAAPGINKFMPSRDRIVETHMMPVAPAFNAVFMQDSIPYMMAKICHTGIENNLQAIGVLITGPNDTANCLEAVFPLSLIPQVEAIAEVTRIAEIHGDHLTY